MLVFGESSKHNFFPGGGSCAVAAISLASGSQGTCEFSRCFTLNGWRLETAEMRIQNTSLALLVKVSHMSIILGAWYCIPLKTKWVKNLILIYSFFYEGGFLQESYNAPLDGPPNKNTPPPNYDSGFPWNSLLGKGCFRGGTFQFGVLETTLEFRDP